MDKPSDVESPSQAAETTTAELSEYFGTPKEVIARYMHCALCGANLHFSYLGDYARNLMFETAKCPECGVKARAVFHKLQ